MDDALKRLLDAEQRAQELVDEAIAKQEQTLLHARQEAHDAEEHFKTNMRELRRSLNAKAEEEAERSVAEMERRAEEHRQELRSMAEQFRKEALDAAVALLTDPERL